MIFHCTKFASKLVDTSSIFIAVLLCLSAYLLGSISAAILICRSLGYPDPRTDGSNNPGTTNVLRIAGKPAAALTLLGDVAKGVLPVAAGMLLELQPIYLALAGLSAFLGHLYPVFFHFQGGKGVATALGVIHILSWQTGLCLDIIWLATAATFRISSLASIASWASAPIIAYYFAPVFFIPIMLLSTLLIYRHKTNIKGLIEGTENRIGQKAP